MGFDDALRKARAEHGGGRAGEAARRQAADRAVELGVHKVEETFARVAGLLDGLDGRVVRLVEQRQRPFGKRYHHVEDLVSFPPVLLGPSGVLYREAEPLPVRRRDQVRPSHRTGDQPRDHEAYRRLGFEAGDGLVFLGEGLPVRNRTRPIDLSDAVVPLNHTPLPERPPSGKGWDNYCDGPFQSLSGSRLFFVDSGATVYVDLHPRNDSPTYVPLDDHVARLIVKYGG
ncbi:hypothetical protein [Actinomadura algeriensis]|uniref:ESAT-6 protein secretion system EspG family protein n=1 Tax=Actinomadura algeriensis TaxID=1679523 RepID=A0ABR9JPX8_9ACTN|nr:hypothetical protein [Actinomadura algeriensis]MBE1532630.1 hypothetical protein [Actinomadura algeriensis]